MYLNKDIYLNVKTSRPLDEAMFQLTVVNRTSNWKKDIYNDPSLVFR